ncbi:hypothetical protein M5X17_27755 [Paenibacillus alvei]|uniref:hypothetical protein n=1 Tax=Paenibacillus alvei TaxID=44250 RepID=UPI0022810767|nr:hypothetical protein [Paenibacillus alvei]MCY9737502.1 hypothetical protein [Paenibacillus alvei]
MKVKLTTRQGYLLERLLKERTKESAIRSRVNLTLDVIPLEYGELEQIELITFVSAVINGWEVVKSPKELLQQEFNQRSKSSDMVDRGWCSGVKVALNATGLNIEGINT